MKEMYLELYRRVNTSYGDALLSLRDIWEDISQNEDLNECADKVYALRETIKVLEQTLKELKKVFALAEKTACLVELRGEQDAASTDYCSGKAKVKQIVTCPSKRRYNPEQFDKLMEYLGVPRELYQREEGKEELLRPHWPEIQELMNDALNKGENIPITIEESNVYSFPVRKKKALK